MNRIYAGKYAIAIAFVILAVAVYLVVTNQGEVSEGNITKMCDAINGGLVESNDRIKANEADTKGLIDFLEGAKTARLATYERTSEPEDLQAAATYSKTIEFVQANVNFDKLTPLDCAAIVED